MSFTDTFIIKHRRTFKENCRVLLDDRIFRASNNELKAQTLSALFGTKLNLVGG